MEYTNLDKSSGSHPGVAATPLQQMFVDTEDKLRLTLDIPTDYNGTCDRVVCVPDNLKI
jgi:hypothetical protein